MIAHRVISALRLSGLTIPELCRMLGAADRSVRWAVQELESAGSVRPTWRCVQGKRGGPPARVWELAA